MAEPVTDRDLRALREAFPAMDVGRIWSELSDVKATVAGINATLNGMRDAQTKIQLDVAQLVTLKDKGRGALVAASLIGGAIVGFIAWLSRMLH